MKRAMACQGSHRTTVSQENNSVLQSRGPRTVARAGGYSSDQRNPLLLPDDVALPVGDGSSDHALLFVGARGTPEAWT